MRPAEGVIAVAMRREMVETRLRLGEVGDVACRDGPHHEMRRSGRFEPLRFGVVEATVDGVPNEMLKRFDAFPNRKIHCDIGALEQPEIGRVVALVLEAPDEA